jgi:hypothetical protein
MTSVKVTRIPEETLRRQPTLLKTVCTLSSFAL